MGMVYEGVSDGGVCKLSHETLFPYPFRQPETTAVRLKVVQKVVLHQLYLGNPVFCGQQGQNRLIKSAPHHFHLSPVHHFGNFIEIFRVVSIQPFQERPAVMERNRDFRHFLKNIQKGGIALTIHVLKDEIQVSHRLVGMKTNDKFYF